MKNTFILLGILCLLLPLNISAQDTKSYDFRLKTNIQLGVNELRFTPGSIFLNNPSDPLLTPILLTREKGRAIKAQVLFSIVWKRMKDASLKENWGLSLGYAFNAQEYLQYIPGGELLRRTSFRSYRYFSVPLLLSKNFYWGRGENRLELSLGPEFSFYSGGTRGFGILLEEDEYLRANFSRSIDIGTDLSFMALWKGQLFKRQDIGFGFGINYALTPVVEQEFSLYRNQNSALPFDINESNLLYRVNNEVFPISYFLILQYDLPLSK